MIKKRIKDFTKGFITAAFLASFITYAGTLIDGMYQFADGELISAFEMNHNFQQIRGNVLVEATNASPIIFDTSSQTQVCGASGLICNLGYLSFGNVVAGSFSTRTDPSADATASESSGQPVEYIMIPVSGFYEITLIVDPKPTYTLTVNEPNEYVSANNSFHVVKFDATDPSKGALSPNTYSMSEPFLDGNDIFSSATFELGSSFSKGDSDSNGIADPTNDYEYYGGGKREVVYLTAGTGLAVVYEFQSSNGMNIATAGDGISYGIGSVRFKVKQILD